MDVLRSVCKKIWYRQFDSGQKELDMNWIKVMKWKGNKKENMKILNEDRERSINFEAKCIATMKHILSYHEHCHFVSTRMI